MRYMQNKMRFLDLNKPIEKGIKYTGGNRDTSHYKANIKSVIYLFYFERSI